MQTSFCGLFSEKHYFGLKKPKCLSPVVFWLERLFEGGFNSLRNVLNRLHVILQ
jgi:hypothetical protein